MMTRILVSVFLAVVLAVGLAQLYTSFHTPVYRDEAKYNEVAQQINSAFAEQSIGSDEASDRFYKNQDDNMTDKYQLEQSGWLLVIMGFYGFLGVGVIEIIRKTKKNLHVAWLYALALVNIVAGTMLGVVSLMIDNQRGLFPYWADSLGIPIFGFVFLFIFAIPITVGLVVIGTLRYKQQKPDCRLRKFLALSPGYKAYFIVSCILLILFGVLTIIFPTYDSAPLLAGSMLYLVLLYGGVRTVD